MLFSEQTLYRENETAALLLFRGEGGQLSNTKGAPSAGIEARCLDVRVEGAMGPYEQQHRLCS